MNQFSLNSDLLTTVCIQALLQLVYFNMKLKKKIPLCAHFYDKWVKIFDDDFDFWDIFILWKDIPNFFTYMDNMKLT